MPPYTKLPKPEGSIFFDYSPMSPPNWGIVPFRIQTLIYSDVKTALKALLQAATTIHAQRLESGDAPLLTDNLYFRGQSEITHRLLPSRLRSTRRDLVARDRIWLNDAPTINFGGEVFPSVSFNGPPSENPSKHVGDWYEEVQPMREIEKSAADLSEQELVKRDTREQFAIERATQVAEVARLDSFQKRATVRHYSDVPSALIDVSTNPEVAAFFATGADSQLPSSRRYGLLWAIDLNCLSDLFTFEVASVPGGLKIKSREQRETWGVNKRIFEGQGIMPASLEFTSVALPFHRPLAQHARFLSMTGEDGATLPLLTELTWWSIIERRSYACGFIQDGNTYVNPSHNITRAAILSDQEGLAAALASGNP